MQQSLYQAILRVSRLQTAPLALHSSGFALSISVVVLAMAGLSFSAEAAESKVAKPTKEASSVSTSAKSASAEAGLEPMLELTPQRQAEVAPANAPIIPKSSASANDGEFDVDDAASVPGADTREPLKARAVLVDIDSQTLNYDKEKEVYVATGSAHVVISEQNSELTADKVTYDQNSGMLIAEGHVVIVKGGQKTFGTYAKIDLNRQSALINDPITTVKAVRIKAQKSFVSNKYIELEDGKFIISGDGMYELNKTGGLHNFSNATGKGSNQSRLRREYFKKIRDQRAMFAPMDPVNLALQQSNNVAKEYNFDEGKSSVSRFSLKAKEIEIHRSEDGIDDINLKWPSLYMGRFKIGTMPENEFAYDNVGKQYTYLGPDIGSQPSMGGLYVGPGWDFKVGRGFVRFSPIASLGNPGFVTTDGKNGEEKGFGPGVGGMLHYRDMDTTLDLAYNSRVGTPVGFFDRRLFSDNTHLMASFNDLYKNGLIEQNERPNYITQITDYRVLKQFNNFMLTSFESAGWARDNFNPNNRSSYFVNPTSPDPLTGGRLQLQAQIQNVKPLLQVGNHVNFGVRGQVGGSAYTTGDYLGILRGGPTMNLNFKKVRSSLGYYQTVTSGASPFVFDAYVGGAQNLTLDNTVYVNKYLILGSHQSLNLRRDNATNSLAVGNTFYMLVGPQDVKMQVGYDVVNRRSSFGIQYFPGGKNTVVNFDRMKIYQPENYGEGKPASKASTSANSAATEATKSIANKKAAKSKAQPDSTP